MWIWGTRKHTPYTSRTPQRRLWISPRELDDPYTGKPASLAREKYAWLYHFAGYPPAYPPR